MTQKEMMLSSLLLRARWSCFFPIDRFFLFFRRSSEEEKRTLYLPAAYHQDAHLALREEAGE